jgi:Xaa-Pro aminopeptidase
MYRRGLIALLLVAGSVTSHAQITLAEYAGRRSALADRLGDGVFVVRGAEPPVQDYLSFFQNPGFLYLTGYREAGAALLMTKRGTDVRWILFTETKDPAIEVWSGYRYGPQAAGEATGITARPIGQFGSALDSALRAAPQLTFLADLAEGGDTLNRDDRFIAELRKRHPELRISGANDIVTEMRGKKSPAELDLIRRAAAISMEAHREAALALEPGMNEFEIQALLEYTFRRNGADRPAYASIVGSGPNATVLHYNKDDRVMQEGELLLIDAAASYGGYAADVTRTFPVSGTFTREQREVYQIVRAAQAAAERNARPGASWRALGDSARAVIAAGLTRLGLIDGPQATYECTGRGGQTSRCSQVGLFYMHGLGHGIGLVVHDPDQMYAGAGQIGIGSAFSIEPGIYVRGALADIVPATPGNAAFIERLRASVAKYADIGVRIEDNYVVTDGGLEWISCVAREADEVEALMHGPYRGPAARDAERVKWYGAAVVDPARAGRVAAAPPKACHLPRM